MPRKPPNHGTRSGYTAGCRCRRCREANRAYILQWRHSTGRADPAKRILPGIYCEHGTLSRYQRGCKCDPCRAANTSYHRAHRLAKKIGDTSAEVG